MGLVFVGAAIAVAVVSLAVIVYLACIHKPAVPQQQQRARNAVAAADASPTKETKEVQLSFLDPVSSPSILPASEDAPLVASSSAAATGTTLTRASADASGRSVASHASAGSDFSIPLTSVTLMLAAHRTVERPPR